MGRGTPIVRDRLPALKVPEGPKGPLLYSGDSKIVEAWNLRARGQARAARGAALGLSVAVGGAALGGLAPPVLALATLGGVALGYPILALEAASRAAQKPFEVFEEGLRATERHRLLRFRRFVVWAQVAHGQACERAPGRFQLRLTMLDGTVLESVPGELGRETIEYVHSRTGEQVHGPWADAAQGKKPGETLSKDEHERGRGRGRR